MIKEVIFDIDGVIVKPYDKPFSQKLAEKQGIPLSEVEEFFKEDYDLCAIGKADLHDVLPKYLDKWKWIGTIDELLQLWFVINEDINEEVIDTVGKLKSKDIRVGIATDKSETHGRYLLDNLDFLTKFDDIFMSHEIGVRKSNHEFFAEVIQSTGLKPEEIQFWDDDQKNVDAAKSVGIDGRLFTKTTKIRVDLL